MRIERELAKNQLSVSLLRWYDVQINLLNHHLAAGDHISLVYNLQQEFEGKCADVNQHSRSHI